MVEAEIFVGFKLLQKERTLLDAAKKTLYMKEDAGGLVLFEVDGFFFLGKFCDALLELSELELLSKNILSLTAKLLPESALTEDRLVILPHVKQPTRP